VVPPFVGVAVNVTLAPEQIAVELAFIETEGVTELALIVISLLVAVGVLVQFALLVITTVILSPSLSVFDIKLLLFVPAFTPFNFH
jgi:hypothetical protein